MSQIYQILLKFTRNYPGWFNSQENPTLSQASLTRTRNNYDLVLTNLIIILNFYIYGLSKNY